MGDSYSLDVTFTWTGTPTGMAGISTNGPEAVDFSCYPVNTYQDFTFSFSQLGDGCPYEYTYDSVYSTCDYTADVYNSQTWDCTWTVPVISTTIVDGGPTTALTGVPATITAPLQWVTVTSTQQITSTSTSVVDPGAKTVTVTASQAAAKLRRVESPTYEGVTGGEKILGVLKLEKQLDGPASDLALSSFNLAKGRNSTDSWLEDRDSCLSDEIFCGVGCCLTTQSCIGDGSVSCCNGFECVPFDASAPFLDFLYWSWDGFTATSISVFTTTTYTTVNPPGETVTVDGPTSTTNIDFFVTKVVTTIVTSTDPVVTITKFPSNVVGPSRGVGGGQWSNGESAITVTVGSQTTAPAIVNGTSNGKPTSTLGFKVGVGVGVPFAVAILAALLFLIFRRRRENTAPPLPANPETSANNSNAGAMGGRPVSQLPPYTANRLVAAGLARKPVGGVSSAPDNNLPERHYTVNGFYPSPTQSPPPGQGAYGRSHGSSPTQSMYSGQGSPPQQMPQAYVPPAGYQGQEMYAGQPPQQQRVGNMGYSPQSAVSSAYPTQGPHGTVYPPQNPHGSAPYPSQNMGYQGQPDLAYHPQPGHEMYVPHENEGVVSYQAMPGPGQGLPYINEVETSANAHEMPETRRR